MAGERSLRRARAPMLIVGVCVAMLASAASAVADGLTPPGGFRLPASSGYSLTVVSFHKPNTDRGEVLVYAQKHDAAVLYFARATVTDTSIEADLGRVGKIDVDFAPSGETRMERSQCGGKGVAVDSGRYVGTIEFQGERGYSEAHATSAQGNAQFTLSLLCPGGPKVEGIGGHSPGALLTARGQTTQFHFEARKNSPTRVARFNATIDERRGQLRITRGVAVKAGPAAFDYDVSAGTATVSPPAPFDGEATYRRGPGKSTSWHGDLTVDFPGRPNARLATPGSHASLIRAVQNPSHPFRLP